MSAGEVLFDSELKMMEILWREGELSARRVADIMSEQEGWNINTTYTVLRRLVAKGIIERGDPGFNCRAALTRRQAQIGEIDRLVDRMFDGSYDCLLELLLDCRRCGGRTEG